MEKGYFFAVLLVILSLLGSVRAEAGFGAGDAIALILGLAIFFVCCFAGLGWLSRRNS